MAKYRITIETDDPNEVKKLFGGGIDWTKAMEQITARIASMEVESIRQFGEPGVRVRIQAPVPITQLVTQLSQQFRARRGVRIVWS